MVERRHQGGEGGAVRLGTIDIGGVAIDGELRELTAATFICKVFLTRQRHELLPGVWVECPSSRRMEVGY
jgi:hypothetical protein